MSEDTEKAEASKRLRMAVVELRKRLGLSQSRFGDRVEKALPTIQRWETLVPPKGNSLASLVRLAEDTKHPDLAEVFRLAFSAEVGMEWHPSPMSYAWQTDEPEIKVDADDFFAMRQSPVWAEMVPAWKALIAEFTRHGGRITGSGQHRPRKRNTKEKKS